MIHSLETIVLTLSIGIYLHQTRTEYMYIKIFSNHTNHRTIINTIIHYKHNRKS